VSTKAWELQRLTQEGYRTAALWRERSGWLRSQARRWLSSQRQIALDATEANVDALGRHLSRLHQEQGGLLIFRSADAHEDVIAPVDVDSATKAPR